MEEKPKPSHAGRWITLALLAVPLIYVLTFPWVSYSDFGQPVRTGSSLVPDPFGPRSALFELYAGPYRLLLQTPLREWILRYDDWCFAIRFVSHTDDPR